MDNREVASEVLRELLHQFASTQIINLKHRADRKRRVMAQFRALGIDMEAARGRFVEGKYFTSRNHFKNAGVRGCFESHLELLFACAASGKPMLICEDDVEFRIDALAIHHANGFKIPESGWDIIYFGLIGKRPYTSVGLLPYHDYNIGLHCYGVMPEAAGRMASYFEASLAREPAHPEGGCIHPDGAMNDFRYKHPEIRSLIATPCIATQFASRTDLGTEKWFDRILPLRPLIEPLRQLRGKSQFSRFK